MRVIGTLLVFTIKCLTGKRSSNRQRRGAAEAALLRGMMPHIFAACALPGLAAGWGGSGPAMAPCHSHRLADVAVDFPAIEIGMPAAAALACTLAAAALLLVFLWGAAGWACDVGAALHIQLPFESGHAHNSEQHAGLKGSLDQGECSASACRHMQLQHLHRLHTEKPSGSDWVSISFATASHVHPCFAGLCSIEVDCFAIGKQCLVGHSQGDLDDSQTLQVIRSRVYT